MTVSCMKIMYWPAQARQSSTNLTIGTRTTVPQTVSMATRPPESNLTETFLPCSLNFQQALETTAAVTQIAIREENAAHARDGRLRCS